MGKVDLDTTDLRKGPELARGEWKEGMEHVPGEVVWENVPLARLLLEFRLPPYR